MKLNWDNLPISSISVFLTGFVTEQVQNDHNVLFKSIKITVTEFTRSGSAREKFLVKCRYLKLDQRIDKKIIKTQKNSNIMVIGKLTQVDSEFQVDIQDINFFPMSIANLESSSSSTGGSVSSLYSWSEQISERMSAQAIANASLNTN